MTAKILVVDDELDLQELMKRRFRRELRHGDISFVFANDGVNALEKLREIDDIDLVITDINMPRMDGLTLLEHLGEYEEQLKAIIISAYGDMDNIRAAMNRGAADFVTKPIDFDDLQVTVKKTLDQLDVLKEAFEERLAAERARSNLARYFAPVLADTLAKRDEPFGAPRKQNIAVLFVDIRGFTTMAEGMEPEAVMELLRGFHARMEDAVFRHDGNLDNYIGDAVLATFGVPELGDRDAVNALACAYSMLDAMEEWNAQRAAQGEAPIGVGIGLHYGSAVLGDTGSERSMAFAVIGDTVNTASRIQGLTRGLETDLVVSQALIDQINQSDHMDTADLLARLENAGEKEIRGRSNKVPVFVLPRG